MALDFGIYQALDATPNFADKRRDEAMNLSIAEHMEQQNQQRLEQRGQALNELGMAFNAIDEQTKDLLPQDQQRVKAKHDELQDGIIKKIQASGNNVDDFLMNQGGTALIQKYGQDLYGSPEFQNGLKNKENLANGMKASTAGLTPKDVPSIDGTSTVPWEQAVQEFQQGKRNTLPFTGAFKSVNLLPLVEKFSQEKLPPNADGSARYVPLKEIQSAALLSGEDPDNVNQTLRHMGNVLINPKNPELSNIQYGMQDPLEREYKQAEIAHLYAETQKEQAAQKQAKLNPIIQTANAVADGTAFNQPLVGDDNYLFSEAFRGDVLNKSNPNQAADPIYGMVLDKKTGNKYFVFNSDVNPKSQRFLLNNIVKRDPITNEGIWNSVINPIVTNTYSGGEQDLNALNNYAHENGIAENIGAPQLDNETFPVTQQQGNTNDPLGLGL